MINAEQPKLLLDFGFLVHRNSLNVQCRVNIQVDYCLIGNVERETAPLATNPNIEMSWTNWDYKWRKRIWFPSKNWYQCALKYRMARGSYAVEIGSTRYPSGSR